MALLSIGLPQRAGRKFTTSVTLFSRRDQVCFDLTGCAIYLPRRYLLIADMLFWR
jgi:hypothetical protein